MKLNEVTDYGRDEADDVDFEHAIALAAVYDIDKFIHKAQDRETVRLLTKHKISFIKNALIDLREMIESSHETWDYGQVLSPPTLKHLKLNIEVLDKIDSLVAWKELDTIIREYKKLLEKDEKK